MNADVAKSSIRREPTDRQIVRKDVRTGRRCNGERTKDCNRDIESTDEPESDGLPWLVVLERSAVIVDHAGRKRE